MTNYIDASSPSQRLRVSERPSALIQRLQEVQSVAIEPGRSPPRPQLARPPHISWGQLVRVALLLLVGAAMLDGPRLMRSGTDAATALMKALQEIV
jgi:hypothetical protein